MNILIVDDQRSTRLMLRKVVEDIGPDIGIVDFEKPLEALLWAQHNAIDLVLLDYRMPEMDGLQFARQFRRIPAQRDVPIVMISVVGDEPVRQTALDVGATDFLVKPVRPRELLARCKNLLALRRHAETSKQRVRTLEHEAAQARAALETRERELMLAMAQAAELRHGAGAQLARMARFAALIAERLELPDAEVRLLELAAPLHDIGMIAVPDAILLTNAPLDEAQRSTIRRHTQAGWELLHHSANPMLRLGATVALSHHERWQGGGYPEGLSGAEIPLAARIVALADVFDALLSRRPYRAAWSLDAAVEHVRAQAGAAFDPACVRALLADPEALMQIAEMQFTSPPPPLPAAEKRRA